MRARRGERRAEGVIGIARGQVEDGPQRQRRPGRVGRRDTVQEGLLVGEAGQEGGADADLGQRGALAQPVVMLLLNDEAPFGRRRRVGGDAPPCWAWISSRVPSTGRTPPWRSAYCCGTLWRLPP